MPMSTNLAARFFSLVILFGAAGFFTGCKTASAVDWNSRKGVYTYAQAVADMGQPNKQTKLNDGKTVAQWITLHGSNGFTGTPGVIGGNYGMGAGQPVVQSYQDHVLELTFDADGRLLSWAKNY